MDLSRRNFIQLGTVGALAAFSGTTAAQSISDDSPEYQEAAILLGPKTARPSPSELAAGGDDYERVLFAYIYRTIAGDTFYTTQDMDSWQPLRPTAVSTKAHRVDPITDPALNTWTSVSGFSVVEDESPNGFVTLQSDTTTFEIQEPGLYRFNGCFKMQNNTTGQQTARVLIRLYANNTSELRCSQRQWLETINSDSQVTFPYGGTDTLQAGDTIQLQYYTDNDSISFDADDTFQNPVTATFSADYVGPLP